MAKARIVIIGGGYAGVHSAKLLHKRFKRQSGIEITLIDRNPYHTLMTELHEVAGGRVDPEAVKVSFARIFAGKRVNVVLDSIETVDFAKREVVGKSARYAYDYLVVGLGSEPESFGIKGIEEHALTLWSLEDALKIRDRVEEMFHLAGRESDPERRRELLSFVVGGAGFTGIELAGELLEHKKTLCRRYNVCESEVSITIVEALDKVCTMLSAPMQKKAQRRLERMGARILLSSPIVEAQADRILIKGGTEIATRTFVWTAGIGGSSFAGNLDLTKGRCSNRYCQFVKESGTCGSKTCTFRAERNVPFLAGKRGRLLVNAQMQSPDYENVYVVGDNLWFMENDRPLPQIVETALQTAETACANIGASIEGKAERESFRSSYHGHMVSIGGRYGVAHVVGMNYVGFFALAIKHLINVHYLWGVAAVNACWEYIKEEFLTIRERRSLIGGLAAARAPSFMLLPLRLFVGAKWLIEGIKKIQEGWLVAGANGWLNPDIASIRLPGVKFAAAADAVSAASEAAATTTTTTAAAAPALMPAIGLYTWFAEKVLSLSPAVSFLLQAVVVLAEIAIGLALIGGTFTFIAAAASIALGVMFIFSGWGNPELLWYMVAGVALLFGAGQFLGLDYWIVPFLKKWWSRRSIAQKTYLYAGEPGLRAANGKRDAKRSERKPERAGVGA